MKSNTAIVLSLLLLAAGCAGTNVADDAPAAVDLPLSSASDSSDLSAFVGAWDIEGSRDRAFLVFLSDGMRTYFVDVKCPAGESCLSQRHQNLYSLARGQCADARGVHRDAPVLVLRYGGLQTQGVETERYCFERKAGGDAVVLTDASGGAARFTLTRRPAGYCRSGVDCWGQLPLPSCGGLSTYGYLCNQETFTCRSACPNEEQPPPATKTCVTQQDCRGYERFTADGASCECTAGNTAAAPKLDLSCNNFPCTNQIVWCGDGVCQNAWWGGI
jgi:hypothetical protein